MLTTILSLLVLGGCTGFLAGLLGIGGGMILTPFMTMLLAGSVPQEFLVHIAIATSLSTILFTSLSSIRAHHKRGAVLWKAVAGIAPGILVGGVCGARISSLLPTFWLSLFFATFVGFSAVKMFLDVKPAATRQLPGLAGLAGAGFGIGGIASILGAGGGFLSVPFMVWCNVQMKNAVATSAALGFPIAVAGTIGYVTAGLSEPGLPGLPVMLGFVHLPSLASVAAASVLTAPLGARLAHSMNTRPLKRIFAVNLLLIALYMARHAFVG